MKKWKIKVYFDFLSVPPKIIIEPRKHMIRLLYIYTIGIETVRLGRTIEKIFVWDSLG